MTGAISEACVGWIDRVALVWGALIWGLMAMLASAHGHPEDGLHPEVIKAVLLLAGVPWLILRGLRFAIIGSLRGRIAREAQGSSSRWSEGPTIEVLPPEGRRGAASRRGW